MSVLILIHVARAKLFQVYLFMITQICLALGVPKLPGINHLVERTNITDLRLIWDIKNPMAKQVRREDDIIAEMFR